MHPANDEFSGRPVAEDAHPPLQSFRDSGGRSFHEYPVHEVREIYVRSTAAAALDETDPPEQTDFDVDEFRVRLYEPRPDSQRYLPTPGILFMHGGGWVMGDLRTHHSTARRLAVHTGFPVLAVDYRLAPEHRYPAAVDDCRHALRWFAERCDLHGVRVSSLSLIGDSAGGQLAAVLTNEAVTEGFPTPIDAQVLLYPVTDLTEENLAASSSYRRVTAGFPLVADTMRWFADIYVDRGEVRHSTDLSPLRAELPEGLPATYVITVENDPLAEEGARYAAKLAAAGARVRLDHLVGYAHGLFTSAGKILTGEHYLHKAADFITEHAGAGIRPATRVRG